MFARLLVPVGVRPGGVCRGATGEVLTMTTAVYSYWAGDRAAAGASGVAEDVAWSILVVLLVISARVGWVVSGAVQRQWRLETGDQGLPSVSPDAWGEPDLAPPSTSPEALAEVAELETLWRQSGRRRRSASSD